MSEKLLEADFISVDIRSLLSGGAPADAAATSATPASSAVPKTRVKEALPSAGDWAAWSELLKARLEKNKTARNKKPDYEIEQVFFEEFFKANWEADIAAKLIDIGEPLRKILKVLGIKETNQILIFITLDFTKELLRSGKLNILTFKAIYNAVAKKLVADSEFIQQNNYNIIYCKDLYNKSPKDIEQYLEYQSSSSRLALNKDTYTAADQIANKRTFCHFDSVGEHEPQKYVEKVFRKENPMPSDDEVVAFSMESAKLNSLDVVKLLLGKNTKETIHVDTSGVAAITSKITSVSHAYAALLAVSMNSDSTEARKALALPYFKGLNTEQINAAVVMLATSSIIPKGHIQTADADAIVNSIVTKLSKV